jgi:hypothetical protein
LGISINLDIKKKIKIIKFQAKNAHENSKSDEKNLSNKINLNENKIIENSSTDDLGFGLFE